MTARRGNFVGETEVVRERGNFSLTLHGAQ
jgi:hypothetical protein